MTATEQSTERLVNDLKRIAADCEALMHDTKDAAGDQAQALRSRLADTVEAAKRTCRRLEERGIETAKAADKTIREHPYESIGIAFGVGLLIGVLVGRK